MRTAIFHDYMTSVGGAERAMISLAKAFDADIITTDFNKDVLRLADGEKVRVIQIGELVKLQPLRIIQACLLFSGARFDDYDMHIFSGNWSCCGGKHHQPNIWYCHSPVRIFYDNKQNHLNSLPLWKRLPSIAWVAIHSRWDKAAVSSMNLIATNSQNVKNRIKRYLDRDSIVVYGPTRTSDYRFDEVGDYWLSVTRLYPEKRVEMQVEVFRRLPKEKLLIVADIEREETPRRIARRLNLPPNVELLGAVDQKRLQDLYAGCRGFITTALDEDFGLTPVEAMASGKAVLATEEGGYRETIVHGVTGWLLPVDVNAFVERISSTKVEDLERMKDSCIARAREFDEGRFIERMRELVKLVMENDGKSA